MKKMILLLLSGLLIASMAGSAMAGIDIANWPQGQSYIVTVVPNVDKVVTLNYTGILDTGVQHTAGIQTWSTGRLNASLSGLPGNKNTGVAVANGPAKSVLYTPGSPSYQVNMTINSDKAGDIEITDLDPSRPHLHVSVAIQTQIPEFPTIALPVAGLLGILFVFGRKKGDM